MKTAKKLILAGLGLSVGFMLIKWMSSRYVEVDMALSEPLSDGDYNIIGITDIVEHIKIRGSKIYQLK